MTKFFEYLDDFGLGINEENKAKFLSEEKQQIINAVTHGNRMEFYDASETAGEQYYTSTFKANKETLK